MTRWLALVAVVALAGCGSSVKASHASSGWLAFAGCMRMHGVAKYPDPAASGTPPKESPQQLDVSSTQFDSAQHACRSFLPNGGLPPSQAQKQHVTAEALAFARCVRSHGVPNFPDPGADGRIPDPATVGINQGSPKFQAANDACAAYRPPYMPSNAAYDAYARSH